jgi:hypothetical protein
MPITPSPRVLVAASLLSLFGTARSAAADNCVLYWNQRALDTTRLSRNPPPVASLFFATFHVAIYDAINGITRTHRGWLVNDPAPAGANVDAAAAGAAMAVYDGLWGLTSNPHEFELAYQKALAAIPDGQPKADGIAWGRKVAAAVLLKLADSGYDKPIPGKYSSTEQGKWRETPSAFRPPLLPFWGHVRPFVLTSASQFRAPPPETLGSKEYAEEIAFVNRVGPRYNAERTEYQTLTTPFWSDDLGTATPCGHWNVIAQDIARRRGVSADDCARLFALLNMAEADAAIACWDTKYYYNFWRPENAIREQDPALNPAMVRNPDFVPNLASPSFPSYTSGHSTFSAAGATILARFFGSDAIEFSVGSDGLPGAVHTFKKLSDAQKEAGMSRVWGGIHTMSDNLEAQKMGVKVADWVWDHALPPAPVSQ